MVLYIYFMSNIIINTSINYMLYIPLIRDIDDAVIRPLPRAKRMLSEPTALPHLVQLLLTFDPSLVDKVVTLLNNIMEVRNMANNNECYLSLSSG